MPALESTSAPNADEPGTSAGLNQATIYLAEATVTAFDDLIRAPDESEEPAFHVVHLAAASGLDGRLYIQRREAAPPGWVEPLKSIAGRALPPIEVQQAGAVLLVRLSGRIFAFAFGQGRYLLNHDLLVDDFGLRAAANMVDPERVRSVDGRTFVRGVLLTRHQASRPGRVEALGVQVDREMFRAITGRSRRAGEGRVHGATSLGLTRDMPFGALDQLGRELLASYSATDYQASFSSLDRMRPLPRDSREVLRLNEALLDDLRSPDISAFLAPPKILDWAHVSGFRLGRQPRGSINDDLDVKAYLSSIEDPQDLTFELLGHDEIRVLDRDSPRTIARWSVLQSLVWETTLGGQAYVLSEGRWYRIEQSYLEWVDAQVAKIPAPSFTLPAPSSPDLVEEAYNREAARSMGAVLLDKKLARVNTKERGGFELCDLYLPPRNLIHVKRGLGSQELTYLFEQGVQAAEGYRNAREVRERLRNLVESANPAAAADLPVDDRPQRDTFQVVYAVIAGTPQRVPRTLPFFARAALARAVRTLDELDFRCAALGIDLRP